MDGLWGGSQSAKRTSSHASLTSYVRIEHCFTTYIYRESHRASEQVVFRSIDELEFTAARTARSMNLPRHGRRYTDKRKWRPP